MTNDQLKEKTKKIAKKAIPFILMRLIELIFDSDG
jgi:hypothetical protein